MMHQGIGIIEWWSWWGERRACSLFPVGSEIAGMICTGFFLVFMALYLGVREKGCGMNWGAIRGLWRDPWCVGGDFNVVRFPDECGRDGGTTTSMRRFSNVIEDLELRDMPMSGGHFTWSGGLNNNLHSRLDRFFITENWETLCNGVHQKLLLRPVSDHHPILLEGGRMRGGPTPFRFENMWLKERGFKKQLSRWWSSFSFRGSPSFVLATKLKALKSVLKI